MIEPIPTKRTVCDVGKKCNMNCLMCYYAHLGDLRLQGWARHEELKKIINDAYERGDKYIEFTGGEPTLYPQIDDLIKYALNFGMKSCIITNGTTGIEKAGRLLQAGLDDFLISWHGSEKTHDLICQMPGARKRQLEFLSYLKSRGFTHRFNCVMSKYNEFEIDRTAQEMAYWKPRIINFIHINPHHASWADKEKTLAILPDMRKLEPMLNKTIEYLETKGIGVNLRYWPMCRIAEKFRRCVCNGLHVCFDPYEWNYPRSDNFSEHRRWSIENSKQQEEKGEPCCRCDLIDICGGINKRVNAFTEGRQVNPISDFIGDKSYFYFYRRSNTMTLGQR